MEGKVFDVDKHVYPSFRIISHKERGWELSHLCPDSPQACVESCFQGCVNSLAQGGLLGPKKAFGQMAVEAGSMSEPSSL